MRFNSAQDYRMSETVLQIVGLNILMYYTYSI